MFDVKKGIASLAIAGSLFGGSIVGAAAAPPMQITAGNGSAGLVSAIVDAVDNVNVELTEVDIAVVELNNSLNNLTALNNVLNNSPILSNNEDVVDITVIDGDVIVTDVLNDLNVDVNALAVDVDLDTIVAVIETATGDVVVITR